METWDVDTRIVQNSYKNVVVIVHVQHAAILQQSKAAVWTKINEVRAAKRIPLLWTLVENGHRCRSGRERNGDEKNRAAPIANAKWRLNKLDAHLNCFVPDTHQPRSPPGEKPSQPTRLEQMQAIGAFRPSRNGPGD
jgi:hypothetical protein